MKDDRHGPKGDRPARWLFRQRRRRVAIGPIGALLVGAATLAGSWWVSRPGEIAPAFTLPASTGASVRLEDYRGKQPALLVFYMVGSAPDSS